MRGTWLRRLINYSNCTLLGKATEKPGRNFTIRYAAVSVLRLLCVVPKPHVELIRRIRMVFKTRSDFEFGQDITEYLLTPMVQPVVAGHDLANNERASEQILLSRRRDRPSNLSGRAYVLCPDKADSYK